MTEEKLLEFSLSRHRTAAFYLWTKLDIQEGITYTSARGEENNLPLISKNV